MWVNDRERFSEKLQLVQTQLHSIADNSKKSLKPTFVLAGLADARIVCFSTNMVFLFISCGFLATRLCSYALYFVACRLRCMQTRTCPALEGYCMLPTGAEHGFICVQSACCLWTVLGFFYVE